MASSELHEAVYTAHSYIVKANDGTSRSPEIEVMSYLGAMTEVRRLLDAGEAVNRRDYTSRTPLDYCVTGPHRNQPQAQSGLFTNTAHTYIA